MPSNSRAENQYYGKMFESIIVSQLNKTPLEYKEDFSFDDATIKRLSQEAQQVVDLLKNHTAIYTGDKTSISSGDILLDDGTSVEIKRVSSGTGTYFNTSIFYFLKFGFDFKKYMLDFGLYEALETHFGDIVPISRKNNSPVSNSSSSLIRHNYNDLYTEHIVPIDSNMRISFTQDIADYFKNNPNELYTFLIDMLTKNTETSQKTAPDRLIVYNYTRNTAKEINLQSFFSNVDSNIRVTDKGLVIGNIRLAFSWQNGNGLNNPTIRVYLIEE